MRSSSLPLLRSDRRLVDPVWRFHPLVALAFAGLCVAISHPGRLNVDTLFEMVAARRPGLANNWHSPTLGWFWSLLAPWLGQPGAGLAAQAALFGLFAGFLPPINGSSRARIALAGELLLRVVLAGSMGYVGKDETMLLALLLMVQLVRRSIGQRPSLGSGLLLGGVVLLFLLAKAPNFLTLVVAVALVVPLLARTPAWGAAVIAAALILGVLAVPLNRVVDARLFGARDLHPDKQIVLFDLAGISVQTGHDAFAGFPGWNSATLPPVASCYVPWMWDSFAHWGPCGGYSDVYDRADRALTRYWAAQVVAHPLAYARHRLRYFHFLLESRDHATWGAGGRSSNDTGDPAALAEAQWELAQLSARTPITPWHAGAASRLAARLEYATLAFPKAQWVGLVACLATLLLGWRRRDRGIRLGAQVAAALGAGHAVTLLLFGVADPARYTVPVVVLGWVALLAMVAPADPVRPRE